MGGSEGGVEGIYLVCCWVSDWVSDRGRERSDISCANQPAPMGSTLIDPISNILFVKNYSRTSLKPIICFSLLFLLPILIITHILKVFFFPFFGGTEITRYGHRTDLERADRIRLR